MKRFKEYLQEQNTHSGILVDLYDDLKVIKGQLITIINLEKVSKQEENKASSDLKIIEKAMADLITTTRSLVKTKIKDPTKLIKDINKR